MAALMDGARKVILFIATSLDGYIARADGGIDWLFSDQDYGYTPFFAGIDTVLMGRRTYEVASALTSDPFEGRRAYVFSRRRAGEQSDNTFFTDEPPADVIARLRQASGRNLWLVGGSQLVQAFVRQDLIDEYVISIHPVILGDGIPLFAAPLPTQWLTLQGSERFSSGLVQLNYRRSR